MPLYKDSFSQLQDGTGTPYAGAKLYFYDEGTTTPKDTYTTRSLGTPNANPVVADGDGRFGAIWLGTGRYKAVAKTSADVTIYTNDGIEGTDAIFGILTTRGDLLTRDATGAVRKALIASGKAYGSDGNDVVALDVVTLAGNNTLTGNNTIQSTDAGAAIGPTLVLDRDSASPAASDIIGGIIFRGNDSAANNTDYVTTSVLIDDPTNGSEDGRYRVEILVAGSAVQHIEAAGNVVAFPGFVQLTSTDAGAGVAPNLILDRNSASPAVSDVLAGISFTGRSSGAVQRSYGQIIAAIIDPTNGSEDGSVYTQAMRGGSLTTILEVSGSGFSVAPYADNVNSSGNASQRWVAVWAVNGTIQTSDATDKDEVASIADAERRVGERLLSQVRRFKMRDAVAKKGDAARVHMGFTAQEVEAAFAAEGLDGYAYGVLCRDEIIERKPTARFKRVQKKEKKFREEREFIERGSHVEMIVRTHEVETPIFETQHVFDQTGKPVMEHVAIGKDADGKSITVARPMTRAVPVMETIEETVDVPTPTGRYRMALRYDELYAFIFGALAVKLGTV